MILPLKVQDYSKGNADITYIDTNVLTRDQLDVEARLFRLNRPSAKMADILKFFCLHSN